MTTNTTSPLQAAQLDASPRTDAAGNSLTRWTLTIGDQRAFQDVDQWSLPYDGSPNGGPPQRPLRPADHHGPPRHGRPQHPLTGPTDHRKDPAMNAATAARIAAWNVIADTGLPAGTEVAVGDGRVTVRPRGGRPAHIPYGPSDTPSSLYDALKEATQGTTEGND